MFESQIKELRQYINHVDEQIRMYRKQGRNPERLQDNKARALQTIENLKQVETGNTRPLQLKR